MKSAAAVVVVLAAVVATPVSAQEPEKVALALKPEPGKVVRFVHRHETTQDVEAMGRQMQTKADTTTEFSLEFAGTAAGGAFRGTLRFGRVTAKVANPLLGDFDLDSSRPLPTDLMERGTAITMLGVAGAELPVTLDARGTVTKVEGLDAAVKAATERWALGDREVAMLRVALTETKVVQTVGWGFVVTPLPEPLAVGAAWDDVDLAPGTAQGIELRFKTKLVLAKASADAAEVTGTGTVEVGGKRGAGATVKESKVEVAARVSRGDGLPLSVRETATIDAVLNSVKGPVPFRQTTSSTLDRVEAWPSAEAPAAPADGSKPR